LSPSSVAENSVDDIDSDDPIGGDGGLFDSVQQVAKIAAESITAPDRQVSLTC
jgi:hypothetical protein